MDNGLTLLLKGQLIKASLWAFQKQYLLASISCFATRWRASLML
jgi:hypothetical protein